MINYSSKMGDNSEDNTIDKMNVTMFNRITMFDENSFIQDIIKNDSNKITKKIIDEALNIPIFLDFLDKIKVNNPKLVADISGNTQKLLDEGKLVFKITSNGNYSAILRDGNKFAEQITLKKEYFSPNISDSFSNLNNQLQLKEIIERLEEIKHQVDRILEGQHDDRIALCESAIQQMQYSMEIEDMHFKLLCISNALKTLSDGKSQVLLSLIRHIHFIKNADVGFMGANQKDIDQRMLDLTKNLSIFIKASCIESMLLLSISEYNSSIIPLNNCLFYLEKHFDKELLFKLNSNIGNELIRNQLIDKNFWVDIFPKNIEKIANKIEYLNNKELVLKK